MPEPIRLPRTILRLVGPDAEGFVQNLVTNDLDRLVGARLLYAALLSPQGKLIADFFLQRAPDGALVLDADAARGPDLLRRLTLFRLRAQVEITDISADHAIEAYLADPPPDAAADPRLPAIGWRRLGPPGPPTREAAYRDHLLQLGVPDLARDAAPEEVFALEALLEELNGVAFDKGCFVGQENVSRMKRRATTRKKFCPLTVEAASVGEAVRAGEIEIGAVRAARPGRALALLRLDRAKEALDQGIGLNVAGAPARLDPPPWLIAPAPEKENP